jgi:hypothetical protein
MAGLVVLRRAFLRSEGAIDFVDVELLWIEVATAPFDQLCVTLVLGVCDGLPSPNLALAILPRTLVGTPLVRSGHGGFQVAAGSFQAIGCVMAAWSGRSRLLGIGRMFLMHVRGAGWPRRGVQYRPPPTGNRPLIPR